MATLYRHRTVLTGFVGGPGVSTMYFLDQQTAMASLRAFWNSVAPLMPSVVGIQVLNTGDIVESTTGALTGTWDKAAVLPSQGGSLGPYAAPSGACITWLTNTVLNRRRLRGRTFIVPLSGGGYENDGSLKADHIGPIQAAAQALVFEQSLSLVTWSRPIAAKPATATSPAVAARLGGHGLVTASRVADRVAILRSRRD